MICRIICDVLRELVPSLHITKNNTPPWVFFTFFKIVQMVLNYAEHHIFYSFMEKQCFFVNINNEKFLFKIKIANCPLNAIRICKFLMPHFPFVGRWIKNIWIKRYIWQFMITVFFWREKWIPVSITKFGYKSIPEDWVV